ncbi:rod-determining factor RdfA [Natrononativus amylolyticus]|uniref:rod-determining factor RdfA n=1 Tax=Natrononativus amylolyticus TaxID=2963434 RepID=UPI0020CCDD8B|nr:rod-determining factor RdfA [Natrononativus amylolyticus]
MSDDSQRDGSATKLTNSKVGRLIDEHDLEGLEQELIDRWTAPSEERSSLRELADVFNRRLLEAVLEEAGVETIEGEAENTYRLLTDDDVTTGVRTEVRNRLERDGVDVDALEREFVSHQAVHTYLTKFRDVSHERERLSPDERREKELETIRRLQSRTEAVTGNSVERLQEADQLAVTEADVFVDIRVFCRECGVDYSIDELLRRGGCDCASTGSGE